MTPPATDALTVAYFGPPRTFTEEALLTKGDLAAADRTPLGSITDVLDAVATGSADVGFVPIENAIEGTVNVTLDGLIFDYDLLITREVVVDIHLHLMALPGVALGEVKSVASYPHALAQCQKTLAARLPGVEQVAANSTADAARLVGEGSDRTAAAIAPRLAAGHYGLEVLVEDVEDHRENQTRFVSVVRAGVPAATGHDRTSIVCFQSADRPGSLHGILGQFAARNINLTKLESRPTKRGLGDYCFVIDLDGHVGDEVVADCLRDLHAQLAGVKFLGSYPAAGPHGEVRRREADDAWRAADDWLGAIRGQIG